MKDIIFKYLLMNAWGWPLSEISMFERDKNNVEGLLWKTTEYTAEPPYKEQYTLPAEDICRIQSLVDDNLDVFLNRNLEFYPMADGVINDFSFFHLGQEYELPVRSK